MFRRKAKSVMCSCGRPPFFFRRHGTVAVPTDKNKKHQDTTEEEAPEAHKKTAAYYRTEHRMIDALNQQDAYYHRRYTQGERGDNNNAVAKLSSILNYNVRYGEVSITKDLPPMEIIHDGVYYCPVPDDLGYHLPPKFLQEDGVSPMEYVMEGKEELQALAKERSALTGAERAKEAIAAPPPFFLRHYTKHFLNPFFMEKGKLAKNCAQLLGNLLEGKKADPDDAVMFDTVQKPFFHEHLLPDRVGKENTELQSEFLAVRASLSAAMDSVTTDNSDKGSNNNNFNFMVGYPVRQFCVSPVFEYQEYLWQWRAVRAFPRPHYRAAGSSSSSKPKPQRASPQLKTVNLHNLLAYKDKTIKSDKAAERKMETKQQKNEVNTLTSLENYYFMIPFLIYPAKMTPRHVVEDHKVVRPDDYFADAVRQETVIIHDSVYDCIEMQKDFLKSLLKKQEEELNRVGGAVKKAKEKRRRKERLLQTAINDLELYHSKVDFIAQMKEDPLNYYNHRAQYYMPTPVGLLKASNVSYSHNYYDLQNTNTTVEDEKSGTNEKEKLSRWSSHFFSLIRDTLSLNPNHNVQQHFDPSEAFNMRDFLRKVYNVDFYSNNDDLDFNELWAHMKELSTVETIENNVEVLQDQTPSVYEAIYRLKKKKGKKYEKALAKEKQNPKNYNRPRRGHSFHDTRSLPFYYQNVISGGLAKFIVSVDSLASLVLKGTLPLSTACVSLLGDLYLNENRRLMSRHNSGPVDTYFQQQLALHPLDIERELLAVMESKKTLQEMSSIRTASNEASQAAVARDIQSQHDEEEGEDTITSTEEEEDVSPSAMRTIADDIIEQSTESTDALTDEEDEGKSIVYANEEEPQEAEEEETAGVEEIHDDAESVKISQP